MAGGPTYGEFPCAECPQVFKLAGYLERHVRRVHRGQPVNIGGRGNSGKVVCPECLKPFVRRYLAAHLRKQHAIYGGLSGQIRPDRRADNLPAVIDRSNPVAHTNGKVPSFRQDPNLVALVDDENEIWICERLSARSAR